MQEGFGGVEGERHAHKRSVRWMWSGTRLEVRGSGGGIHELESTDFRNAASPMTDLLAQDAPAEPFRHTNSYSGRQKDQRYTCIAVHSSSAGRRSGPRGWLEYLRSPKIPVTSSTRGKSGGCGDRHLSCLCGFAAGYSISCPNVFISFVRTVRGNSPAPHSLKEPKSLYQSPSGAMGSDRTHGCNRARSPSEIWRS